MGKTPFDQPDLGLTSPGEPETSFADDEGRLRGFVVDLLAGIERHRALTLDRVTGDTSEINGAFLAGQLDLLQSYARALADALGKTVRQGNQG